MNTRAMWWGVLGLIAALAGCRNVDLPSAEQLSLSDGGRSPYVALDFSDGAPVALSAPLSFTANSLVGMDRVSVSCGAIELATWLSPPYQAQVDLSPCVPFGQQTDGGEGVLDLALVASAVDKNGHRTDLTFHLRVDVSVPVLTTDIPDRIRPGQPLDFTLSSSLALGATPVVTIADLPTTLTQDARDARIFHGHLAAAPELGIDALTDGGAVTLDVLQDVERTIPIKAEAVAPNGNHGKLTQSVLLTRVLWDKPLPAPLFTELFAFQPEPADAPTPIPGGLVVPLSASITAARSFYPAVYAADSGAITLDQPLLDGGWEGVAIDQDGWVQVAAYSKRFQEVATGFVNPTDTAQTAWLGDAGLPRAQPVARGDGELCGLTRAFCGSTTSTLQCVDHLGTLSSSGAYDIAAGTNPEDGGASQPIAARSGENLFFGGYQLCKEAALTFAVGTRDGGLTFAPTTLPGPYAGDTCHYAQLYPVLPTGDGGFVLFAHQWCVSAVTDAGYPNTSDYGVLVGDGAKVVGNYDLIRPTSFAEGIMGTWGPDQEVMVLTPTSAGTQVFLYPPDAGPSSVASTIPGVYGYPADQAIVAGAPGSVSMPRDVVRGSGGLAVLTAGSSSTRALVRLGPDLQPRWVYRYPRLSVGDSVHLYALDEDGPLYLVDSFNQRVLAIER